MNIKLDTPFLWRTQDGEILRVDQMKTSHLFYTVRMIFNHTVPLQLQIPGCKRYSGPDKWSGEFRQRAVAAMLSEMSDREEIPEWMMEQIEYMRSVARQIGSGYPTDVDEDEDIEF